jgi:hypothetical protein
MNENKKCKHELDSQKTPKGLACYRCGKLYADINNEKKRDWFQ